MIVELLIFFICAAVLLYFLLEKKPDGLPPGEWGWPIIGMLPSPKVPMSTYVNNHLQKYGKTFTWRMGRRTFVFLCDFKTLKAAYSSPVMADRPRLFSHDAFSEFQRLGFTNNNGIRWQNLRRFSLRHLRDSGMGKSSLEEVISFEADCLVKDFLKHTDVITEVPWSVNVAVINVLWWIMASKRYEVDDKKFQEFEKLVDDLFDIFQSTGFVIYDLFPLLHKLIPNTLKGYLGLRKAFKSIDLFKDFPVEAINEHKSTLDEDKPRDYIDAYLLELKQHAEGKGQESTSTFTEAELLYSLSDLFSAGSGSTAATIRWIIIYLIKYPEIQAKVHKQIDEVVPRDRSPSLADRNKLAYVDATFYEVMRIKTVAPFGSHHWAREDTTVENYRIPKETIVVAGIEACHNDPDYWESPEEFNPERFLLPDGSCDSKKEGFLPFSIGRRVCPGESLARMEVFLFAAALLQKFSFSSPEGVDVVMEPDPTSPIFVLPKPFKLIIKERK